MLCVWHLTSYKFYAQKSVCCRVSNQNSGVYYLLMAEPEQSISWQVTTHAHHTHSSDWYWSIGLATLVGIGLSAYFSNYMLAVILFVGIGSIAILSIRGPRTHSVKIDKRGVSVDGSLHPYRTIQSFWVMIEGEDDDQPHDAKAFLLLTTEGILSPHITIPLDDADHAQEVRAYLRAFVEEEEQWPHMGERLAELIGL